MFVDPCRPQGKHLMIGYIEGFCGGPAVFKERLFDCLYNLDRETVDRLQKLEG